MHIGYITPEYPHPGKPNPVGGIGTFIKNVASQLVLLGHRITVFQYGQPKYSEYYDGEIWVIEIPKKNTLPLLTGYFNRKQIEQTINKFVKQENIDILEAPDWTGPTAFMHFNVPLVIRLHGSDTFFCHLEKRPQKFKNRLLEKNAIRKADALVGVSRFVADKTKSLFKLEKEIEVVHNGINTKVFKPLDIPVDEGNILYFGALIRKKGVLELAHIFNEVIKLKPDAHLTLIGKNVPDILEGRPTLELFVQKLSPKAKAQVKHIPHVPYHMIKEHIAKANVVVLPSFAEAFPMTWLEAMAMEKALVTSDIGWAPELMIDGETGYMVNPKNHNLYAQRIVELLSDKLLAIKMGKQARERIINNFEITDKTKETVRFYERIIHQK